MTGDSIEAVADYISKVTHEITSPTTKDGRGCNRAPFRILLDFLATGERRRLRPVGRMGADVTQPPAGHVEPRAPRLGRARPRTE
jgi:hypothetical protein